MKFFSAKIVNLFTVVLSTIFFLSVSVATISSLREDHRINSQFEQMLKDIEAFNHNHNKGTSPVTQTPVSNEKLFDNGTDAFITAYDNYINAESYHVETHGTMTNSVMGLNIQTFSTNIMIKYPDGSAMYELISYEPGNKYGRSSAMHIYYDQGTHLIYMRETKDVKKVGDKLVPTYKEAWLYDSVEYFQDELGIMPGSSIYDFSKRNVINVPFYREIKNSSGEVAEYHTQIISNAALAGRPFARVVRYIGQATKMPVIKQMSANVIIDANGMLKGLVLNDKFEVTTSVPILGNVSVDCESSSSYNFITIGGEISIPQPDVSNAVLR